MSEALARIQPRTSVAFDFTDEQRKIIRDAFLNGATDQESAVLMEVAKVRRLNPLTRQVYFIKRWDAQKRCEVWAAQVAIDGLRAIAERTGLYDGQDEPEFEETPAGIKLCRVRVYRKDWSRPAVGVAYWAEYAQTNKEGSLTSMWARGKHFMLAKCAEALALRKAFPEDTSGLYTPEEMGNEIEAVPVKTPLAIEAPTAAKANGRTKRAEQVARQMRPAVIDVQSSESVEVPQSPAPPVVLGGPHKGTAIASLTAEQLGNAVDWAQDMLQEKPNASNAGRLRDNLAALEAEMNRRISGPAQQEIEMEAGA